MIFLKLQALEKLQIHYAIPNSACYWLFNFENLGQNKITRPSENRCKLYPPETKLTKVNQPSLNLEGGAQGEI